MILLSHFVTEGDLNASKEDRDNFALYVEKLFLLMTTQLDKYQPDLLYGEFLLKAFRVR